MIKLSAAIALCVLVCLCGCDLFNSPVTVDVDQRNDNSPDPCCDDTGTTGSGATFSCVPILQPNGNASSCRIVCSSSGTFTARAVRASDGATDSWAGVGDGSELDPLCHAPGDPGCGNGGGTWEIELVGVGTDTVDLDS